MHYIGIDIAKRRHFAAVRGDDGKAVGCAHQFANDLEGFEGLLRYLGQAGVSPDDSIAVMEATGHYWMALYAFLVDHGYDVAVVNPVLISAFRKSDTLRKTKTDKVDALLIAKFAHEKRPSTSPASIEASDGLKQLARYRRCLVKEQTMLKNKCTAVVDRVFPEFGSLFSDMYGGAACALLKAGATPDGIAATDIRTLTKIVKEGSGGRLGRARAEAVKAAARDSVGVRYASSALAFEIAHIVSLIEHLDEQIAELDAEIARMLAETPGAWLTTIPGVGTTLAAAIAGEIGDPMRFESPRKVIAFAGMDASKNDSGDFESSSNHMSKAGSPHLRCVLLQAADRARVRDPYFGDYYNSMVERGKHHYVALSGVARKLAGVVLALMKEGRAYEPRPSVQSAKEADVG